MLAATKLHIPALRPGHLNRATLVVALIAHAQSRVALVAAAPGSGKTSLLSEWHVDPRESRPFAWAADPVLLRASELARRGVASIEIAYSLLALAGIH